MTLTKLSGLIDFKVDGQEADPKWKRDELKKVFAGGEPPNALRFQCRIATDARVNFEYVELPDGENITLHPTGGPQFGKNADGKAFLTVTVLYSGDGDSYRLRWVGEDVPLKMQKVAVRHDKGLKVAPQSIPLDLAKADITPTHVVANRAHRSQRDYDAENAARAPGARRVAGGSSGRTTRRKRCARLTESDLAAK